MGFFMPIPTPGTFFITDDGRIALLDLGMVGQIGPAMQEHLLKVLLRSAREKATRPPRRSCG